MAARSAYQFLSLRVQLAGRGMTQEILSLFVNGKKVKHGTPTLPAFLNYLGAQGFRVVTAEIETEGIYTHFYTMQREVFTDQPPPDDIFETLEKAQKGVPFGEVLRNLAEFSLFDNF